MKWHETHMKAIPLLVVECHLTAVYSYLHAQCIAFIIMTTRA